jgi:hypothetical protein
VRFSCIRSTIVVVFSVTALTYTNSNPSFVRPETFKALIKLTVAGLSIIVSFMDGVGLLGPPPILLEYNKLPLLNKSVPSVKKDLFSLNCCSNGPKFRI